MNTQKILLVIATAMVLVSLFIAFAAVGSGDNIALAREETNQMQIHENGLTQRAALTSCLPTVEGGCHASTIAPKTVLAHMTVAVQLAILSTIVLLAIGTLAMLRSKPVIPIDQVIAPRRLTVVNDHVPALHIKANLTNG